MYVHLLCTADPCTTVAPAAVTVSNTVEYSRVEHLFIQYYVRQFP